MRELTPQEKLIRSLEDKQIELRKMVHGRWCTRNHNECPETHMFCKSFLNLKTSIAWEAANIIKDFFEVSQPETKKKLFYSLRTLERVLCRHYNKEWKLYFLLLSVGNDFISLIDWKE